MRLVSSTQLSIPFFRDMNLVRMRCGAILISLCTLLAKSCVRRRSRGHIRRHALRSMGFDIDLLGGEQLVPALLPILL